MLIAGGGKGHHTASQAGKLHWELTESAGASRLGLNSVHGTVVFRSWFLDSLHLRHRQRAKKKTSTSDAILSVPSCRSRTKDRRLRPRTEPQAANTARSQCTQRSRHRTIRNPLCCGRRIRGTKDDRVWAARTGSVLSSNRLCHGSVAQSPNGTQEPTARRCSFDDLDGRGSRAASRTSAHPHTHIRFGLRYAARGMYHGLAWTTSLTQLMYDTKRTGSRG